MSLLRRASPGDHPAFARLHHELGVPEAPPNAEVFAQGMLPRVWVAEEEGGEISGYGYYDSYADIGHIRNLVTSPSWRRRGLGRRLMLEMAGELRRTGLHRWCLNVKPDNEAAIALYQGLGLELRHQVAVLRCQWPALLALPPSPACEVGLAAPDEDAELEREFKLHQGQIAANRARPERLQLRLRDPEGRPLAYANWVPGHPGAFPLGLRDLAYARALFAEMHARRSEQHPDLMLTTRVGGELEGLLRSLGAVEVMRVAWMEGPIP
jgi:GNAT superfamily N-acetyltransferase